MAKAKKEVTLIPLNDSSIKQIRESKNVQEIFDVLSKNYDLKNCKPSEFAKSNFILALKNSFHYFGATEKQTLKGK